MAMRGNVWNSFGASCFHAPVNSSDRKWLIPAWIQSVFYTTTGIWPVLEIDSFVWITGPKVDVWLVRTVGFLLATSGAVLGWSAWKKRFSAELVAVMVLQAVTLAVVDVVYSTVGRIDRIYLLDALAETVLVGLWIWALRAQAKARPNSPAI
jgi:hypothetical protein